MTRRSDDQALLDRLQRGAFDYFLRESHPVNGLVRDTDHSGSDASIAAVGMALTSYPVGVERGYIDRADAAARAFRVLRFLRDAPQDTGPKASGHRGFFYHFLDVETGRRARRSELSTMDSAILFAGALTAAQYFDGENETEAGIRELADTLYRRADWRWAVNDEHRISHGWKPGRGFLPYHWGGYNEALLLLVLALGSPERPAPKEAYARWLETYAWKEIYGHAFVYCGPLFTHQLPHVWIDFRGILDDVMRARGIDYFENSRRATLVQREYARRNPREFDGYGENLWGLTAGDGPGPARRRVAGRDVRFWGYRARGVPWGPDDGTVSPSGVIASLPFAPAEVMRAVRSTVDEYPGVVGPYGLAGGLNATFSAKDTHNAGAWLSREHFGIEQGPVVLMIENARSELIWRLTRGSPHVRRGLERAGFTGGWLEEGRSTDRPGRRRDPEARARDRRSGG